MSTLLWTIVILVAIYFLQFKNPFFAGLVAVIPIKILFTSIITIQTQGKEAFAQAIQGMLFGQFFWGAILLFIYWSLKT